MNEYISLFQNMDFYKKLRFRKNSSLAQMGFSLVELMVVVAIMGIMAVVLMPNVTSKANDRADFEKNKILFKQIVQRARNDTRNNLNAFAWMDIQAHAVYVDVSGPVSLDYSQVFDTGTTLTVMAPYAWPDGSGEIGVERGRLENPYTATVKMASNSGYSQYFAVYPLTGQVREIADPTGGALPGN